MSIPAEIKAYISSQPEPKRSDMQVLHERILRLSPTAKLWFLNGRNSENKVVSNPNIGYGTYTIQYAKGDTGEFYQVGLSANTTGLSIYIMGVKDKAYLADHFKDKLGKASVTGYCIKFKALKDIHIDVLEDAIRYGFEATRE